MTITVSTADPRDVKALALLRTADRWVRGHRKADGRSFWSIPSQTSGAVYMTDTRECTCPDFGRRQEPCKHVRAARLRVAELKANAPKRRAPKPAPAADAARAARSARVAEIRSWLDE